MRAFLFLIGIGFCLGLGAEEQATISIFRLQDGRTLEAIRFAAAGDEGARVFMLTTVEGARITIGEKEIKSREERVVLLSELPSKGREQIQSTRRADANARAVSREEAEIEEKNKHAIATHVRKEIDARIAVR